MMTSIQLLKQAVWETRCGHFVLSPEWLDQAVQVIDLEDRKPDPRTLELKALSHDGQVAVWNWLIAWRAEHGNLKVSALHISQDRTRLIWQVGGKCYSEDLQAIFHSDVNHRNSVQNLSNKGDIYS